MNPKYKLAFSMMGLAGCLALATTATAQVSADALLDKLVAKGILKQDEADELKSEAATNNPAGPNGLESSKFKISKVFKNMELYGDLRFRYEYRSAEGNFAPVPGVGTVPGGKYYDTADRWRYALRLGVRGDLADNFYYGLRLETSPNPRSTWNTFGNSAAGTTYGPFSKGNNYSLFVGLAYLGWRPTSWLDISVGRVPQPLYTTPMVWDSDFTPEGVVEKVKFTRGPLDFFATLGQYIYQDVTPGSDFAIQGGSVAGIDLGQFSDQNAYLLTWQVGATYHIDPELSVKVAPTVYNYVGHGNQTVGFYGAFVGQGVEGFTFAPGTSTSSMPGAYVPTTTTIGGGLPSAPSPNSYNQTGINNLFILEFPMEVNFKLGPLDARAFGDYSLNLEGDQRATAAYNTGEMVWNNSGHVYQNPFPGGIQLNQSQALQAGVAIGNNLGLVYGTTSKKGTWEARAYWQHVEQYALDPNLLDSDFFEGRGNLEGFYSAIAYSFTDGMIGTLRYGYAQRINNQLGTGGYNADLPLPNPVNRYQIFQADITFKF